MTTSGLEIDEEISATHFLRLPTHLAIKAASDMAYTHTGPAAIAAIRQELDRVESCIGDRSVVGRYAGRVALMNALAMLNCLDRDLFIGWDGLRCGVDDKLTPSTRKARA